jgi:peptidyl-prolyl cis-trans isomerase C
MKSPRILKSILCTLSLIGLITPMTQLAHAQAHVNMQAQPKQSPAGAVAQTLAPAVDLRNTVPTVNGARISRGMIEEGVKKSIEAGLPNNDATRQLVESELIAREAMRQEGKKRGLDRHPAVVKAMNDAADGAMGELMLKESLRNTPVTDADVRRKYDEVAATMGSVEYKARTIRTTNVELAQRLTAQLSSAPQDFAALAKQHSQDRQAVNGGEMEWISFPLPVQPGKTQWLPLALADAVSKLQPGQVSVTPVSHDGAWYVVKLDAMRPTVVPTFEESKVGIRTMLERAVTERAVASIVGKLVGGAKIERVPAN